MGLRSIFVACLLLLAGAMLYLWTSGGNAVLAQRLGPRDLDRLPSTAPALTSHYGEDPLQNADLRLPAGKGPFPVVIVVHGGCWTSGFATKQNTAAMASELTKHGYATWNIEYRQVGDVGGGWTGTFLDWAAAADYLRTLAKTQPLDLSHVYAIGHSAGAHAALWLASRRRLAPESEIRGGDPLLIRAAVAIDGPGDLRPFVGWDAEFCGQSVIVPLMGGTPAQVPGHYAQASPIDQLPLHVPQYLIEASFLRPTDAENYVVKAKAAGDHAELIPIANAGHFDIIAPGTPAWQQVQAALLRAMQ
jgi:acetyl esterase/lipase